MSLPFPHTLAIALRPPMREAGRAIMDFYQSQKFETEIKNDGSFVTSADKASDMILQQRLTALFPNIPIISEESFTPENYPPNDKTHPNGYFLLDPLDGTNGFLQRTGHFAINIALMYHQRPVFGFIWSPSEDKGYFGAPEFGAFIAHNNAHTHEVKANKNHFGPAKLVVSSHESNANHLTAIVGNISKRPIAEIIKYGSALKFGLMCEGMADIYPRQTPCYHWDIAAGHAILLGMGGKITSILDNKPLQYNQPTAKIPPFMAMV